jgi:hypothetical protein
MNGFARPGSHGRWRPHDGAASSYPTTGHHPTWPHGRSPRRSRRSPQGLRPTLGPRSAWETRCLPAAASTWPRRRSPRGPSPHREARVRRQLPSGLGRLDAHHDAPRASRTARPTCPLGRTPRARAHCPVPSPRRVAPGGPGGGPGGGPDGGPSKSRTWRR